MPSTTIEVRQNYTPAEEVAIIDAVHEALVAAFQIGQARSLGQSCTAPVFLFTIIGATRVVHVRGN